jgi:hypothetical protein
MKPFVLILGIASCLEEDLLSLSRMILLDDADKIAIGLDCATRTQFNIQHVATYHSHELEAFRSRRRAAGLNLDYVSHSHKEPADRLWPLVAPSPFSGSSSLLGSQVAVGLGYNKIILCGCPLQGPNYTSGKKERYDKFQNGWIKFAPTLLQGKVRSMNGWTAEFLGHPNEEWLNES